MENIIIHKAATRGLADHGWLKSHQSFSFAGYYNPERIQFGALRVLNDDIVDGGRGLGEHPHDNMEIISIPLRGGLVHMDSMGNSTIISPGEIQVMSAGTGIYHTEYNQDGQSPVSFLQIWLYPNARNVEPRYDQAKINITDRNILHQILSPNAGEGNVWIHQNAWFHMGYLDAGVKTSYQLKAKVNGVYAFVIEGDVTINGQQLNPRDGMGINGADTLNIKAESNAQLLLMEVPMKF